MLAKRGIIDPCCTLSLWVLGVREDGSFGTETKRRKGSLNYGTVAVKDDRKPPLLSFNRSSHEWFGETPGKKLRNVFTDIEEENVLTAR